MIIVRSGFFMFHAERIGWPPEVMCVMRSEEEHHEFPEGRGLATLASTRLLAYSELELHTGF